MREMDVLDVISSLLLITAAIFHQTRGASFYGESYIHLPFENASSTSEIVLQFKTHRPHGLLFLAAGDTDYLSVELQSGIIHVKIELGSGEAALHSPVELRLDDLQFHTITVAQDESRVSLMVDDISQMTTRTAGNFFELNIQDGIFLGGTGTFTDRFNRNYRNFRGCLQDVHFNGYDIIRAAQDLNNPLNIFEISWTCDDEFDADSNAPISFRSETSFAAFPHLHIRSEGTIKFDIKTRTLMGIVLFNAGRRTLSKDFIALEIINGQLKLSLNKGSGVVVVKSQVNITDAQWHQVDIRVSSKEIELVIDQQLSKARFDLGDRRIFDLEGHLFIGGVGIHARASAMRKGLVTFQSNNMGQGSIQGCVDNIEINSRKFGFHDIQVSRMIDVSCQWPYPCASSPCIDNAECIELDNEHYQCQCDVENCYRPESESSGSEEEIGNSDLVAIHELRVDEGSIVPITTNNIDVVLDYKLYNLRESSIQFHVKVSPKHGQLEIDLGRRRNGGVFTVLDLMGQKVSYLHDGTDTSNDDITIEMEIHGDTSRLPRKLQEKYEFVLPVIIFGTNDPPTLRIGGGGILHVVADAKININNDILSAVDSDSVLSDLVYHVTYQSPVDGYFERSDDVGNRIASFTQEDVDNGLIWFVHHGASVSYYRMLVTDGTANSNVDDLKVVVIQLVIQLTKNTGLNLPDGTSAIIHSQNLTVSPNVPSQSININYQVTSLPQFGEIQKKQTANFWVPVDTFSQIDIDSKLIRYKSRTLTEEEEPNGDMFKFTAKSGEASTGEETFIIRFVEVSLDVTRNKKFVLENKLFETLSEDILLSTTNIPDNSDGYITYSILRSPAHGNFFLTENTGVDPHSIDDLMPLLTKESFTQKDIKDRKVCFRMKRQSFDRIDDFLDFRVTALTAEPQVGRLRIEFIPQHTDVRFTNNGLDDVIEGGQKPIEKTSLYLEMDKFKEFEYSVIGPPQYGELKIIDALSGSVLKQDIKSFTNSDIRNNQLVYKHDDSEHDKDSFMFIATPLVTAGEEPMEVSEFTGTFTIRMVMRNDNMPVRTVDKIFNVVTGKERLITISDIAFNDQDMDYDSSHLQFTRRGIPNGNIIFKNNRSDALQFTQQDLIDSNLIFQHSGASHGRAAIWVTDGQFYTTSLLEIQASDPFLRVVNNTGILAQKGSESPISSYNLSIETNLDVTPSEVRFVLIEEPLYGHLSVDQREVLEFTLSDVANSNLFYKHHDGPTLEDGFSFVAVFDKIQSEKARFPIKIYLETFQHPPKVVHNSVLEVVQGGTTVVTDKHLQVGHINSSVADMVYTVLVLPRFGRLHVDTIHIQHGDYLSFTQEDINSGRVLYTHRSGSATSDSFIFNVGNSRHQLKSLEFLIEIVSDTLPLQVKNMTVREGGRKALTPSHIKVKGRYFNEKSIVFSIIIPPEHGRVESVKDRGVPIVTFSSEELQEGNIYYSHDDSDSLSDSFAVKSRLSDESKESGVETIYVEVLGINDEAPRVVANTGLKVWSNSITLITPENLHVEDPDSPPESVVFHITAPTNGNLALLNNTLKEITNFTQALVNSRQLVFIHRGSEHGEFSFQASDGVHSGELYTFQIYAQPLVLTLSTLNQLQVYPNTIQPITNKYISASTNNENQTKPIIYAITTRPRKGKIVTLMKGRPLEVTSFTQKEVDGGLVYFQHSGYINGWQERDSFMFEVSTLYAQSIKGEMFEISISYANINEDNKENVIIMTPMVVDEGAEKVLTEQNLDVSVFTEKLLHLAKRVSIIFTIDKPPSHGKLYLGGVLAEANTQFTQENINMGELKYVHDHSETKMDAFLFSLSIKIVDHASHRHAKHTTFSTVFNITINPVNDQPFKLITTNPSIQVIQSMTANITDRHLKTIDADTEAMYIQYAIVTPPDNGFVAYRKHPTVAITDFTQADIDGGNLIFLHDGSEGAGTFFFRVSDGAHTPFYKKFNIYVVPLALNVEHNQPIELLQSAVSVYISQTNINSTTNGVREYVTFNVTDGPHYGNLYVQDHSISHFTQTDVDSDKLLYIQTDRSSGKDSFLCDVHYEYKKVNTVVRKLFNITVTPLVEQNPLIAPIGDRVAITRHELDASELQTITGEMPKYFIKQKPQFGKLVREIRRTRQIHTASQRTDIDSFSHEDIVYLKIFYVSDESEQIKVGTVDNFTFVLRAKSVQPAEGVLGIKLTAPGSYATVRPTDRVVTHRKDKEHDGVDADVSVSPSFTSTPKNPKETDVVSPRISSDFVILLAILVPLLVLIIIVIIVVYILWRRRRYQEYSPPTKRSRGKLRPEISGPYQLQQPHIHIQPQQTSPSSDEDHSLLEDNRTPFSEHDEDMNRNDSSAFIMSPDHSRTEVSPAVPMCKVTPLLEEQHHKDSSANSFDWTLIDPEFLKGCSTETPVLSRDQYWV